MKIEVNKDWKVPSALGNWCFAELLSLWWRRKCLMTVPRLLILPSPECFMCLWSFCSTESFLGSIVRASRCYNVLRMFHGRGLARWMYTRFSSGIASGRCSLGFLIFCVVFSIVCGMKGLESSVHNVCWIDGSYSSVHNVCWIEDQRMFRSKKYI